MKEAAKENTMRRLTKKAQSASRGLRVQDDATTQSLADHILRCGMFRYDDEYDAQLGTQRDRLEPEDAWKENGVD